MTRTIRIATLYPGELNLNGDQGNALVLAKQFAWRGIDVEMVNLEPSVAPWPNDVDFLLIGHGSQAAWKHVHVDLRSRVQWLKESIANGVPGIAVGSGQEIFYMSNEVNPMGLGLIYRELEAHERESRFLIADLDGVDVLGYLNRSTDAPTIERLGSIVLTGLHGPVLAKNETLLDSLLLEIARRSGIELSLSRSPESQERATKAVSQVWELEEPLARE